MKVYINPGHDVYLDSGAVNPTTGTRECDIVADAGKMLYSYLQNAGCEVRMLQSDDLAGVCRDSNEWGADIFVSLHCNASFEHTARGTETWFKSFHGQRLANCIQSQIIRSLGTVIDRGVKQSDYLYVLNATDAVAVLVELAFIDERADLEVLFHDLDTLIKAVARGCTDFEMNV